MPFETLSPDFDVDHFTATVHEHTNPTVPTTVIATDQEWAVQVHWETRGHMSNHLPGTWCVNVWIESIGEGDEKKIGWVHVPLSPGADPVIYNAEITVPAGKVSVPPHQSTPFKLVTTVTYMWPNDIPGPMAGYIENPIIQFYNPGP